MLICLLVYKGKKINWYFVKSFYCWFKTLLHAQTSDNRPMLRLMRKQFYTTPINIKVRPISILCLGCNSKMVWGSNVGWRKIIYIYVIVIILYASLLCIFALINLRFIGHQKYEKLTCCKIKIAMYPLSNVFIYNYKNIGNNYLLWKWF